MQVELSDTAVSFIRSLISQITIKPTDKESPQTVAVVQEIWASLETKSEE